MPGDIVNNVRQALPHNKKRITVLVFILLAIPLTIVLALTQQNYRNFASGADVSFVAIHPGAITSSVGEERTHLSALAYDSAGNPVTSGITYEWSMSSTNSVGTLSEAQSDLTIFTPLALGCGQITVIVRGGIDDVTKSTAVAVSDGSNVPDCGSVPTPTNAPDETGITIELPEHNFVISDYQETIYVEPDNVAKVMTLTSSTLNSFNFWGTLTQRGPGINLEPSGGGISPNEPLNINVRIHSSIPEGEYIGNPRIQSDNNELSDLPPIRIVVTNNPPTVTPTNPPVPTSTTAPTKPPTATNTPTPTKVPPTPTPTIVPTATPVPQVLKTNIRTIADSYVRSNRPTKNYGRKRILATYSSPSLISYMKFDLRSMSNKEIIKATLRFKVVKKFKNLGAKSSAIQSLKVVNNSWTENGINYNNRPALGTLATTFVGNEYNQVIELDVTSVVSESNGGLLSFSIDSNKNDILALYSRESRNTKPTLIIEYTN